MRSKVDFPQPDWPTRQMISPDAIASDTESSATVAPKLRLTLWSSSVRFWACGVKIRSSRCGRWHPAGAGATQALEPVYPDVYEKDNQPAAGNRRPKQQGFGAERTDGPVCLAKD
jgi:hypothetical protein